MRSRTSPMGHVLSLILPDRPSLLDSSRGSCNKHIQSHLGTNLGTYAPKYSSLHVLMYSCTQVFMYSCTHVLMYSSTHVLMYSCDHVLMYSCTHAVVYSCTHVLMDSNPSVYILYISGPANLKKSKHTYRMSSSSSSR